MEASMADELRPDEIPDFWRNQPVEPANMSADDVRRKAQRFEAKTRRGFRVIVGLFIFLAAGYGSFLYFFPGTVQRIGSSLTLAGYVYGAYRLHKRGLPRTVPAGPASATCAAYRAELERQREFCLGVGSLLAAFVPGPVVFIMGFVAADLGPVKAVGLATLLVVAPFVVGIPANRLAARKLQWEIDALDALTRQ
jgi:hypothetical protein